MEAAEAAMVAAATAAVSAAATVAAVAADVDTEMVVGTAARPFFCSFFSDLVCMLEQTRHDIKAGVWSEEGVVLLFEWTVRQVGINSPLRHHCYPGPAS